MTQTLIPVILAGGKGERFWPLSRQQRPKQFLCLDRSGRSLLQSTADRLLALAGGWEQLWVITSAALAAGVSEQLPELPVTNLLVEPEGRDTAPAVAWGTLKVAAQAGEEAIIGFFPADHWIGDQPRYEQTLQAAAALAQNQDAIVTLGIEPNYPATGYGYIEREEHPIAEYQGLSVYRVSRFTEKPDRDTATQFLQTGRFSWNSGMFIFRASVVLAELAHYAPALLTALQTQGEAAYRTLEKKSIDYALMEKTQLAYVLPANFGWDDLGDWNALARLHPATAGNVAIAPHVSYDTQGAIIYNTDQAEIIVTIGLEDVVVVRDGQATLVVHKSRTQDIKKVLKQFDSDENLQKFL